MSYNKNLRLIVDNPRTTVYPTGLSEVHQGKWHQFQGGMLEVEDEADIAWLQKHKFFNQSPGAPGSFWEYVPPRDLEKELAEKEAELVEARKIIEENAKAKAAPQKAAAPAAAPATK